MGKITTGLVVFPIESFSLGVRLFEKMKFKTTRQRRDNS
jgi:hypothetical protein